MTAYYNEIEPYAAQWLRNLIAAGHVAPGEVDERSILDVSPDDLTGFTQCHFFAGIGVWSYALRQGGWPDSRPVWTGSCPCQPFSVAGVGGGFDDERHLWPFWFHLIEQRRPPVVFGEQVEAAIRHGWLDLVQSDLEGIDYAFAAVGIPAGGVGAPHIRQRLWFVAEHQGVGQADSCGKGLEKRICDGRVQRKALGSSERKAAVSIGDTISMAHSEQYSGRCQTESADHQRQEAYRSTDQRGGCGGSFGGLEHTERGGRNGRETPAPGHLDDRAASERAQGEHGPGVTSAHWIHQHGTGPTNGFWRNADWLLCRDGKWRPVEPGTFPLAHGAAARVGRLRAYGNAISPFPASEMIAAYLECRP